MKLFLIQGVLLLAAGMTTAQGGSGWRDDFHSLNGWRELTFPKIPRHTRYTIQPADDGHHVLKAETNASASGLICKKTFNPYTTPILSWRWRVENVFRKGDATRKDSDDYPLRVYVLFKYDPEQAPFTMRTKYALARALYGEYPPHAVLNYIWANRDHGQRILVSPYTDRSRLVVMEAGSSRAKTWIEETVNLIKDYHTAFGESPPDSASLAIMSDADNTGESGVGFISFIELGASPSGNPQHSTGSDNPRRKETRYEKH